MIRVIVEHDEYEMPTPITHGIRRATTKNVLFDSEGGSQYLLMCGELLYSSSKKLCRKRGIPTCLICMVAMVEEAVCFP